jgi:hypothetical protein
LRALHPGDHRQSLIDVDIFIDHALHCVCMHIDDDRAAMNRDGSVVAAEDAAEFAGC